MPYTLTELATRVLRDLGLVDSHATPDDTDLSWAEETCVEEVAAMSAEGIRIWDGSEQSVPSGYLTTLSARIGLAVAPSFGLMSLAEAEQAKPLLERKLRKLGSTQPTGDVQKAEYF